MGACRSKNEVREEDGDVEGSTRTDGSRSAAQTANTPSTKSSDSQREGSQQRMLPTRNRKPSSTDAEAAAFGAQFATIFENTNNEEDKLHPALRTAKSLSVIPTKKTHKLVSRTYTRSASVQGLAKLSPRFLKRTKLSSPERFKSDTDCAPLATTLDTFTLDDTPMIMPPPNPIEAKKEKPRKLGDPPTGKMVPLHTERHAKSNKSINGKVAISKSTKKEMSPRSPKRSRNTRNPRSLKTKSTGGDQNKSTTRNQKSSTYSSRSRTSHGLPPPNNPGPPVRDLARQLSDKIILDTPRSLSMSPKLRQRPKRGLARAVTSYDDDLSSIDIIMRKGLQKDLQRAVTDMPLKKARLPEENSSPQLQRRSRCLKCRCSCYEEHAFKQNLHCVNCGHSEKEHFFKIDKNSQVPILDILPASSSYISDRSDSSSCSPFQSIGILSPTSAVSSTDSDVYESATGYVGDFSGFGEHYDRTGRSIKGGGHLSYFSITVFCPVDHYGTLLSVCVILNKDNSTHIFKRHSRRHSRQHPLTGVKVVQFAISNSKLFSLSSVSQATL